LIRAVLFDYDGVIVDSMHHHARAWQRIFKKMGISITVEDIFLQEGRPTTDVVRFILQQHGRQADEETCRSIAKEKENMYISQKPATVQPQVIQLISDLRRSGLAVGLVTGSPYRSLTAVLPPALLAAFDVIITADDVARGKPAPDPYLAAAQKLKLDPGSCLVVENAPLGIQAAKAAGMKVIGITTTLPEQALNQADVVVRHFEELRELLLRKTKSLKFMTSDR